jgi:hypothetical protein
MKRIILNKPQGGQDMTLEEKWREKSDEELLVAYEELCASKELDELGLMDYPFVREEMERRKIKYSTPQLVYQKLLKIRTNPGIEYVIKLHFKYLDVEQFGAALGREYRNIAIHVAVNCLKNNDNEFEYGMKMGEVYKIFNDLGNAIWKTKIGDDWGYIWAHRDAGSVSIHGLTSSQYYHVDIWKLQQILARYLERPWCWTAWMSWMFMDSLIYATIVSSGEMFKAGYHLKYIGGWHTQEWIYNLTDGDPFKMILYRLGIRLFKIIFYVGIPSIAGLFFWKSGYEDQTLIWGGVYSALLIIGWLRRKYRRYFGHYKYAKISEKQIIENMGTMSQLYAHLAHPLINPVPLKEMVWNTKEQIAWPGGVYVLIDILVQEYGSNWNVHVEEQ